MKQVHLSYEEQYQLGYMQGYRTGRIQATREILINCLNVMGKEQNHIPCKNIIKKNGSSGNIVGNIEK
jgi:flagellar biosynthesis/type III secretory pathway protein FliH